MNKRYILYGHGGCYNHGVEAITKSTIKLLREICPERAILLSTHFPEQDKEFGIAVDGFLERNLEGNSNEEVYQSTLEAITSNSVLIHVGGDNYCYNNWERYADIHKYGIKKGASSILWGCSIDEDRLSDELVEVLRSHSLILARETVTFDLLRKRGLDNVCKVSDIAFALEPEVVELPAENYVVINVSPLVCRKNEQVSSAIGGLINYILQETELSVVLLPHVMAKADNDYDLLMTYMKQDEARIRLVSEKLSASQYKYIVSKARACVAARTHVTIAAYSTCVPTLALGYSTKARGIGIDLGVEEYVLDIGEESFAELLLAQFKKMMSEEDVLRKELQCKMQSYKQATLNQQVIEVLRG